MTAQLRGLLRLDLGAFDVRAGLMASVAILLAIVLLIVFGTAGMTAGLAALFVIAADQPGALRPRTTGVLVMTIAGAAIAFVALSAGTEGLLVAVLLTFIVTAAGTLAAGAGRVAATRGLLLSIWAVVALSLGGEIEVAIQLTAAYVVGGLIAAAIIGLRSRALSEPPIEEQVEEASRAIGELVRSPLGWFSLVRAGAAAVAMVLGVLLFPAHPIWAALTVLIVMRPKAGEAAAIGVLRTIGTLLGILAAEVVALVAGGQDVVLFAGFIAAGFGMAAFAKVNYAVMVAFLTALLVLLSELVSDTGASAAIDRLLATVMGAVIAFVAIAFGRWILTRRASPDAADGHEGVAAEPADETPG